MLALVSVYGGYTRARPRSEHVRTILSTGQLFNFRIVTVVVEKLCVTSIHKVETPRVQ